MELSSLAQISDTAHGDRSKLQVPVTAEYFVCSKKGWITFAGFLYYIVVWDIMYILFSFFLISSVFLLQYVMHRFSGSWKK